MPYSPVAASVDRVWLLRRPASPHPLLPTPPHPSPRPGPSARCTVARVVIVLLRIGAPTCCCALGVPSAPQMQQPPALAALEARSSASPVSAHMRLPGCLTTAHTPPFATGVRYPQLRSSFETAHHNHKKPWPWRALPR